MCLDVRAMWRKDIDDVVIALSLPARVPHGTIIVISGDGVKGATRIFG
jgi:hypothetical protein